MRTIVAALFCLLPAIGWAEEFTTGSTVIAAKVFARSATVTRAAPVSVPAGRHQVVVPDMPRGFPIESLQVGTGKPDAFQLRAIRFIAESVPPLPVRTPQMMRPREYAPVFVFPGLQAFARSRSHCLH